MKKVVILFVLGIGCLIGQHSDNFQFRHHLGISVSGLSGSGLTYRFYKPDYAIRIAGYVYSYDDEYGPENWYEFGATFEKNFIKTKHTRLYGLVGFKKQFYGYEWDDSYWGYDEKQESSIFAISAGFGLEIAFLKHITLYIDVGERYFRDSTINRYGEENYSYNSKGIGMALTLGLGYSF
ncbi:MAG: hypothetical protein H8E71_06135 [Candidatus Marinimicrobia bacterium]|nr:hypothetical protein [Candidatus Neomarinimicrobiota bacterium]MBL7109748.1 hypothetical protein [Candidatus Neomarinimicrobiota bacterium]